MFDFHQKRKLFAFVNSRYFQGGLLLLVIWIGHSAYVRFEVAMEMRERSQLAKEQAVKLEEQKESLEKQVEYLSSERGVEAEMRRQFDVALPGEKVVVIVEEDDDESEILPLSSSTKEQQNKKWYQFWR
ncbi:septum formation initiator family protein [Candidatus Kaiserbacteria bacterium]|nr:septum formation initiator family protein [Candidatus Kaiserbacteria bacterium]